jgi:AraC-like DNA-binding protein
MILWISVKEVTNVLSLFTELSFYQDWWWNLFLVAVVIYTGISGLTQIQPTNITFDPGSDADATRPIEFPEKDYSELADRLESIMLSERLYLQSDLSLSGLAKHLQVNAQDLSATINSVLGLNYNDYINGLRIKEFESLSGNSDYAHYSLLALAHEAGFNSKATFYRSFKKIKGITPKEYLDARVS